LKNPSAACSWASIRRIKGPTRPDFGHLRSSERRSEGRCRTASDFFNSLLICANGFWSSTIRRRSRSSFTTVTAVIASILRHRTDGANRCSSGVPWTSRPTFRSRKIGSFSGPSLSGQLAMSFASSVGSAAVSLLSNGCAAGARSLPLSTLLPPSLIGTPVAQHDGERGTGCPGGFEPFLLCLYQCTHSERRARTARRRLGRRRARATTVRGPSGNRTQTFGVADGSVGAGGLPLACTTSRVRYGRWLRRGQPCAERYARSPARTLRRSHCHGRGDRPMPERELSGSG
jgi:hypothetical protein